MPSWRIVGSQAISGEGDLDTPVDAVRATITAYPPAQGEIGSAPPRLLGLGRLGYLVGEFRDTGQSLQWELRLFDAAPAGATGVWWSLLPGVVADLELLALSFASPLDGTSLGNSGDTAGRAGVLVLT